MSHVKSAPVKAVAYHCLARATAPFAAVNEGFGPGDSVAILGNGPLGLLHGIMASMHGAGLRIATDFADLRLSWINTHVRQGHGPLGAAYPQSGFNPNSPGQQEGDTPSFLHVVSPARGLNDPEKPDQGGWGGKFVRRAPSRNHWFDDPGGAQTVWRWRSEVQQDFARRADWMKDPQP